MTIRRRSSRAFYSVAAASAAMVALAAFFSALQPSRAAAPDASFAVIHNVLQLATPPVTNTARGASTVNSADIPLGAYNAIRCTYEQSAHGGTPSTTYSIQNKSQLGSYESIITSAAITADNTPTSISAGVGVATTANVGAAIPLGSTLRVTETVAGSATPTVTGRIDCYLSK